MIGVDLIVELPRALWKIMPFEIFSFLFGGELGI